MIHATAVIRAGYWTAPRSDLIRLAFEERHRRRAAMRAEGGLEFLLDLPEAVVLRHGDALLLDDGRIVEVQAQPEALLEVCGSSASDLMRLAWHIGNRHVPAAIQNERILIRPDHVIRAMVIGLGGHVSEIEAPFDPERGAYAGPSHLHDPEDAPSSPAHDHAHAHG